jgi:NitT/TauT family transport system permease protein
VTLSFRTKTKLTRWTILVLALLSLEYVARAKLVGPSILVPPSLMVTHLWKLLSTGKLTVDLIRSFSEIGLSFLLAVLIGIPVGIFLSKFSLIWEILSPYLLTYYAIPIFALYPFFIALLGVNILPILLIGWLFSVIVIIVNTTIGLQQVRSVYIKVGNSLRLSPTQMFFKILFPAAAPHIFTGLKLGFIYALIGTIAAEFILATEGLGYQISFAYNNFDTKGMYANLLLVIFLSVVVHIGLSKLEK